MKTTTFLILRKLSILVILFLIFTAMLTAQVRIKESVEIGPKASSTISKALASSRTHTIGINASWNGANTASLSIWNACDYSIKYSVGPSASPINWTMEGLKPGTYPIDFNIHWEEGGITTVSTMTIFVDGVMQSTQTLENFVDAIIPGYTDYTIGFDTGDMGYEGMSWTWSRLRNYCGEEEFFPSSTVLTMTISEGAEFASLYSYDTQSRLGPSYSGTLNDLNNVVIAADGILPPVGGARVVVEVSGFGETKIVPMTVYPSSLIVKAQPSQISMYGSSGISIRPYPSWGRKAMVYIDSGASYGTLYRSYFDNDKEVYIFGDTLYDVNIGSGVGFSANEQEPDSAVEVHITAKRTYYSGGSINENTNDFPVTGKDTISGSTTIIVKPSRLVVTATPAKIMQGDTSWLEVKQKLPDGTIADLGPLYWSAFEILNTDTVGMLSTMDGTWQDLLVYDTQPYAMFIADRDSTLPDSVDVRIKAEICDDYDVAIGMGKVVVKKDFDSFKILLTRDTLKNREIAIATVIAIDKDSNEVQIDPLIPMNLSFKELSQYVDFISTTGDTLDALTNVPYGVLRNGQVKVISRGTQTGPVVIAANARAMKKNSTQAMNIISVGSANEYPKTKIIAVMATDATKTGFCDLILKPEVKVIAVADSIKPYYPTRTDLIPESESQTEVKVAVTVSGILYNSSIFPYRLEISSVAVEGSGGHSHTGNRPTGRFIENNIPQLNLYKQSTGDTIRATYRASMFGGKEKIFARLMDLTPVIADTDSVVVRVPNLVLFGGTGHYQLTGDNNQHPNNHYLENQNAVNDLIAAANGFQDARWNRTGTLRLNDMSLQFGGLFDKDNSWNVPHRAHRIGKSVDIENIVVRDTTGTFTIHGHRFTGTLRVADGVWLKRFKDLLSDHNWIFVNEGQTTPNTSVLYPHFRRQGE